MTNTFPRRRTTLQCTQIFFTDALTFIAFFHSEVKLAPFLSEPMDNPPLGKIVRAHLDRHPITGKQSDIVHTHLSGNMTMHLVAVVEAYPEGRARQRFKDTPFHPDDIFGISHSFEVSVILISRMTGKRRQRKSRELSAGRTILIPADILASPLLRFFA